MLFPTPDFFLFFILVAALMAARVCAPCTLT